MRSELVLRRFVENYYEIHGDFSGIDISVISQDLRYWAKENALNILEYCYYLLGYPAHVTDEELNIFSELQLNGMKALEEKALPATWCEEVSYKPKLIYRADSTKNKKVLLAEKMLFNYLKNTDELTCTVGDVAVPVKDYVMYLKSVKKNIGKKEVLQELEKNKLMVRFVLSEDAEWSILNKTFIYNNLTEKQIEQVKLEVVSDFLYGEYLRAGALGDLTSLPFLAFNDRKTYLALLDVCRGLGITYADYMDAFNLVVPDQTLAVKELDCIVQCVGDYVYYTTNDCTDDEPLLKMPVENFESIIPVLKG